MVKMGSKEFTEKLASVKLDNENVFISHKIKDIDKSPCHDSICYVYDFDESKKKIVNHYKLDNLSSCDALKIPNENRIDFIEFKSITDILKYHKFNNPEEFDEKIKNLKLSNKIKDSYQLLSYIVNDRELGFSKKGRDILLKIEKLYIIVFDTDKLSPIHFIMQTLNRLSIDKKLETIIQSEIKGAELFNISSPIIKNCKTIDDFYQ